MTNKEFRDHIQELLSKQRPPKSPPTPDTILSQRPMTSREFKKHLADLVNRQRTEAQPAVKKPPQKSASTTPPAEQPPARKPIASVSTTRTFTVRRKSR